MQNSRGCCQPANIRRSFSTALPTSSISVLLNVGPEDDNCISGLNLPAGMTRPVIFAGSPWQCDICQAAGWG